MYVYWMFAVALRVRDFSVACILGLLRIRVRKRIRLKSAHPWWAEPRRRPKTSRLGSLGE